MPAKFLALALISLLFALTACDQAPAPSGPKVGAQPRNGQVPVYHFAIHPLHNPAKLTGAYQPLIDYLNARLAGIHLVLEASRDYGSFEEKYRARRPELLLPNPWQTLQAMEAGYRVIAMAGIPEDFKGIFVVRRDSGLSHPGQLKGKAVSYPSPTALAACIMPQYFLYQHGIKVASELDNRYVGSQESSIMNAYLGATVAGATWPPPWRAFVREHPQEAAQLRVIWETEPLINNSVMVRDDLPESLARQIRQLLMELHGSPEGKTILDGMETARFLAAGDADYDTVRRYVARFEQEVRPVAQP